MMKIRVGYLIDTVYSVSAGTEKQLVGIIKHLDRARFIEPILICLRESPWMKENILPFQVISLGYQGFFKSNFPAVVHALAEILDRQQIDILQTFFEDSIFVGFLGKLLSRRKPILLSSRRDIGMGSDEAWYHRLFKTVLPLVNIGFEGITTNSLRVKEYVAKREMTSLNKIEVIHNAVDLNIPASGRPVLFDEFPADLWICIIANLKPIKRLDVLINALFLLRKFKSHLDFHVVVLGEGKERHRLESLASNLGIFDRVHFMGSVQNVGDYLEHVDIGVLCSDKEGLSNAILEYMAYGLPVVATDVGGNCELVDESNGICVPPNDPHSLASALMKLSDSRQLRQEYGLQGIEKVRKNHSWENIIKKWEDYYCLLVGNKMGKVS